jgi:hypothetical protein
MLCSGPAAKETQHAPKGAASIAFDQLAPWSAPALPAPSRHRERVQQIRQLVKRGKDPRHVIVTADDADTYAARETWPQATIAQLREGYGLNGHFTAVQAIRQADRVTIIEHSSQKEGQRQHVLKVAAGEGRRVERHESNAFHQWREEQAWQQGAHNERPTVER